MEHPGRHERHGRHERGGRRGGTDLGPLTWTDIDDGPAPIVVVPVGSCEQHGPHLPLDTDTTVATSLASRLADGRADCVVAPPLAVTASGEHGGFAGTLSIGTEVMAGVVIELARSADWAAGVVFVNGHGGNVTAMQRASEVFEQEGRNVLIWWPNIAGADPHAGRTETSLMLAIEPEQVRVERAEPGPVPSMADLVNHGVRPLSERGVLGDPTTASGREGAAILDELVRQLVEAVDVAASRWAAT
jgi:mycofactocin system creatininase family protein